MPMIRLNEENHPVHLLRRYVTRMDFLHPTAIEFLFKPIGDMRLNDYHQVQGSFSSKASSDELTAITKISHKPEKIIRIHRLFLKLRIEILETLWDINENHAYDDDFEDDIQVVMDMDLDTESGSDDSDSDGESDAEEDIPRHAREHPIKTNIRYGARVWMNMHAAYGLYLDGFKTQFPESILADISKYLPENQTPICEESLPNYVQYFPQIFCMAGKGGKNIKSDVCKLLYKTMPQRCLVRSIAKTCTDCTERNPEVAEFIRKISYVSCIGAYRHARAKVSFHYLMCMHRMFAENANDSGIFPWAKESVFLFNILREYMIYAIQFCFALRDVIRLYYRDTSKKRVMNWDVFEQSVLATMDEARELLTHPAQTLTDMYKAMTASTAEQPKNLFCRNRFNFTERIAQASRRMLIVSLTAALEQTQVTDDNLHIIRDFRAKAERLPPGHLATSLELAVATLTRIGQQTYLNTLQLKAIALIQRDCPDAPPILVEKIFPAASLAHVQMDVIPTLQLASDPFQDQRIKEWVMTVVNKLIQGIESNCQDKINRLENQFRQDREDLKKQMMEAVELPDDRSRQIIDSLTSNWDIPCEFRIELLMYLGMDYADVLIMYRLQESFDKKTSMQAIQKRLLELSRKGRVLIFYLFQKLQAHQEIKIIKLDEKTYRNQASAIRRTNGLPDHPDQPVPMQAASIVICPRCFTVCNAICTDKNEVYPQIRCNGERVDLITLSPINVRLNMASVFRMDIIQARRNPEPSVNGGPGIILYCDKNTEKEIGSMSVANSLSSLNPHTQADDCKRIFKKLAKELVRNMTTDECGTAPCIVIPMLGKAIKVKRQHLTLCEDCGVKTLFTKSNFHHDRIICPVCRKKQEAPTHFETATCLYCHEDCSKVHCLTLVNDETGLPEKYYVCKEHYTPNMQKIKADTPVSTVVRNIQSDEKNYKKNRS